MDENEINFLREEYQNCSLNDLWRGYIVLNQDLTECVKCDEGRSALDISSELDVLTEEINSRSLDEKATFLRCLSGGLGDKRIHTGKLAEEINYFVKTFLPVSE